MRKKISERCFACGYTDQYPSIQLQCDRIPGGWGRDFLNAAPCWDKVPISRLYLRSLQCFLHSRKTYCVHVNRNQILLVAVCSPLSDPGKVFSSTSLSVAMATLYWPWNKCGLVDTYMITQGHHMRGIIEKTITLFLCSRPACTAWRKNIQLWLVRK